jgi:hypothetical protein
MDVKNSGIFGGGIKKRFSGLLSWGIIHQWTLVVEIQLDLHIGKDLTILGSKHPNPHPRLDGNGQVQFFC